ncbi:MAG: SPOR domain-containing protein [Bacteroidales bacterium]|jgi:hypothetical protein|nr:SPOR domain-containing protein [Bacteroidales bacterium]
MKKGLIVLAAILAIPVLSLAQRGKPEKRMLEEFCMTTDEIHLYRLINEYRLAASLEIIPVSNSLSYVAHVHIRDLYQNRPDLQNCNLHSWSDKGDWTPCCYAKDPNRTNCMWNKPRELTGYKGNGQELILWENVQATPLSAFDQWRNFDLTNDMFLNRGRWAEKEWKAMGVALYEGYASVWFGEVTDPHGDVKLCTNATRLSPTWLLDETARQTEVVEEASEPVELQDSVRYYLIVSSFKEKTQANKEVERLKTNGYNEAKVIFKETNYRVSVYDYTKLEEAQKTRKQLTNVFKGLWIMEL